MFLLLWETEALHDALYNSLTIAIISATLSTTLGIFAARATTRYNFPWKKGITGFLLLPIVLPEIIVGVALLVVMVQLGLSLSAWTVVIGHVLICTPFAIVILSSAFNSFDMSLEEASQDLGVGKIGIVDKDKVSLSNLHRQIIFTTSDIKKSKSLIAVKKLKKINPNMHLESFQKKIVSKNINQIAEKYDVIVDGSDNFSTRFLINDYCLKNKKILISGAVNKFDGQIYTFNFLKRNSPCLRCFIPSMPSNPDVDNCEHEGIIGTLTGIIGTIQANEAAKEILGIGDSLCGYILIIDALKLSFRKVKLNKRSNCYCNAEK